MGLERHGRKCRKVDEVIWSYFNSEKTREVGTTSKWKLLRQSHDEL